MRKYLLTVVLIILAGTVTWWYFWNANDRVGCLAPNEYAEYEIDNNDGRGAQSFVTVSVKDNGTNEIVKQYRNEIQMGGHYYPVDLHDCGYYYLSSKNFDPALSLQKPGYKEFISRTDFAGKTSDLLLIAEKSNEFVSYYKNDFRVSPSEDYILLLRGMAGPEGDPFAVVVKNTDTLEDQMVVPVAEIMAEQEIFASHLQPIQWTDDSRYVWVRISATSLAQGWVRIDTKDWSYDVYKAPEGIMNGYVLNLETGWVPLIPDSFFSGIVEMDEIIREERAAAGKRAALYLYNIFTEEQVLVEQTNEPIWQNLAAVWRDNQTLEYSSPSGERKTYRLEE